MTSQGFQRNFLEIFFPYFGPFSGKVKHFQYQFQCLSLSLSLSLSLFLSLSLYIYICVCVCVCVCIYHPSPRVGYSTRSIFKRSLTGLNSGFSFSQTGCLPEVKEFSLSYYLSVAGGRKSGFTPFPMVLVLCEIIRVQELNSCCRVQYSTVTSCVRVHVCVWWGRFSIVETKQQPLRSFLVILFSISFQIITEKPKLSILIYLNLKVTF